ncbi:hypothetical protein P691DRAFT_796698 [Macrolepiota fuliginosa MF-IS2]|uniref:Uncharacterized protein n=1 Tax=Macrolepiota fuliginosa MF-IS2 TaxID=1400762 RepID=A0A9P5XLV6_9AGAR|nr:hypothetical protein P691DRAFT_796698 [Macrolepiota fuliginosa MF-IS2]
MPKLHLKQTPEEARRRKEKKESRRKRRHDSDSSHSRKRPRTSQEPLEPERKWVSSDEDEEQYGPQAAASTSYSTHSSSGRHKPDQDEIRAEVEGMRFREKLFDAFADDERLDSLEARLNDFAHVPDRWRTESTSTRAKFNVFEDDDWLKMNPSTMDDEEYAEWIRMGMYRKTHGDEYAEEQRQKAARATRRAKEKAQKEETARLEKAAEEERKQRKRGRDGRRLVFARDAYHSKWKALLSGADAQQMIGFADIPWPVLHAHKEKSKHRSEVVLDDLTLETISTFLLPDNAVQEGDKSRKDVLRETFLRFHPDKFEGRFMRLVREGEQESVREGIGRVVRALNTLMDNI